MSDFFGKMITYRGKSDNWNIGEAVMAPKARTQGVFAIRNMKNPSMYEQPRSLGDPKKVPTDGNCNDFNDNCGVHINSGIANIVAANITRLIGQEKAERLYYTVLTQYLKPTSGFHHLRQSIEAACLLFYASEPKTCYYVQWTFEKAEIERQKLLNQFYKRIRKK
jgi:Zn-dependent metalloprotease